MERRDLGRAYVVSGRVQKLEVTVLHPRPLPTVLDHLQEGRGSRPFWLMALEVADTVSVASYRREVACHVCEHFRVRSFMISKHPKFVVATESQRCLLARAGRPQEPRFGKHMRTR